LFHVNDQTEKKVVNLVIGFDPTKQKIYRFKKEKQKSMMIGIS
jgi:hypothetical protein